MAAKYLSAVNAAALDKDLMSLGAFSLDQLMELAGLSVSQVVYKVHPPSQGRRILVACGPGNNGGDGLVAARFSFSGSIRDPFPSIISALEETSLPITSIDAPSSWDIANGPPSSGPGANFMPQYLISLTAPKPLVKYFKGRHFLGGRFVPPEISQKYNLQLPEYEGVDQIVEMPIEESEEKL
ncbi:hypothetical protein NHQ30_001553 [Ciborinia camelliae]|nr:hypothetical protein NHQ30_001553 [Ciborinia camelliae]